MSIHPKAIIHPDAIIGDNTEIGPGVIIESKTEIGAGCVIGSNVVIREYTMIGAGCRIHAGVVLGDTPQDMAFKNIVSFVRIGARVTMREGVTIHRGTHENTETIVGDDCFLMANSHVAHNVKLGHKVIFANGVLTGGYVEVGEGAFVSGNSVIHQFCKIGRLAMIGGLCGISKDVPPFCMTRSVSLNTIVGLNVVGLKRNGFDLTQRRNVKECFNILFREGRNVSQAVDQLKTRQDDPIAAEFVTFIDASKRGICKFAVSAEEE